MISFNISNVSIVLGTIHQKGAFDNPLPNVVRGKNYYVEIPIDIVKKRL